MPTSLPHPFVGRARELIRLTDEIGRALDGNGRVVLVTGEAGIGKSWLVRAAVATAERKEAGLRARWVHCSDAGESPPYWPWQQLLGAALVDDHDGEDNEALERFVQHHAWAQSIGSQAREEPLLLVIDDLQRVDEGSLLLLDVLAQQMDAWPIAVVATVRDVGDPRPSSPHLDALRRHKAVKSLALTGVSEPEARELAEALLARPVSDSAVATLVRATNGNPYFVAELLGALTAEEVTRLERGEVGLRIPSSIEGLLAARLGALDDSTLRLLEAAAVLGSSFPAGWLVRLCDTAEDAPGHADRLDRIIATRLIEPAEESGHLRFVHGLVSSVLLHRIPPSRRALLHARVGLLLETERDAGAHVSAATLAHHFVAASTMPEHAERAVRYSRQAGAEAAARHAYDLAARHHRDALTVLRTTSPLDDHTHALARAEILLGLGRSLAYGGESDAARILGEAESMAERALGADARQAARILALASIVRCEALLPSTATECRTVRARGGRALDTLGQGDPELRARLLAALVPLFRFDTDREPMRTMAREANDLAAASGNAALEGRALGAIHWALLDEPSGEQRLRIASGVLRRAESADDRHLAATARFWRYVDLLELGRTEDAALELDTYERLAERLDDVRHRYRATYLRAGLELYRGHLDRADELTETALRLGARLHADEARFVYLSTASTICFLRNDMQRLGEVHRTGADLQASYPQIRHGSVTLSLFRQRPASAQDDLDAVLERGLDAIPHGPDWLSSMHSLAWSAIGLGDAWLCDLLYDRLRPHAARRILYNFGAVVAGTGHRILANLAAQLGRFEDADTHFRDAVLAAERSQGAFDLMFLPVEWAKLRIAQGADRNDPAVVRLLGESLERADAAGALQVIDQVRALHPALVDAADARAGRPLANRFECSGATCTVAFGGQTCALPNHLGLRYIAALLRRPGDEILATDLVAQVSGETGLSTENARVRVTQRVRFALDRLRDVQPALVSHLAASLRTGKYCLYLPRTDDAVVWRFDDPDDTPA